MSKDHVPLINEPMDEEDSKMESFSRNTGDLPSVGDNNTWEDPMTCCGCIPIKCGMIILAVLSYIGCMGEIYRAL